MTRASPFVALLTLFAACYATPEEQLDEFVAGAAQRAAAEDAGRDAGGGDASPNMDAGAGRWPTGLYEPGLGCTLPECDEGAAEPFDPSGEWERSLKTVATDCNETIGQIDPRANVGNETIEPVVPVFRLEGGCGYGEDGAHELSTGEDGEVLVCQVREQQMGVVSYETGRLVFADGEGSGPVRIYLANVPALVGGDCTIDMEVEYRRP